MLFTLEPIVISSLHIQSGWHHIADSKLYHVSSHDQQKRPPWYDVQCIYPPDPSTDPMTSSLSRTSAPACPSQLHGLFHSDSVQLNPDKVLSDAQLEAFKSANRTFDNVFDPKYETYNHAFGRFEAIVNMGSVKPPQRKGRVPQYSRGKYLNPTFLVKDPRREKFRLVTAFSEVGKYCKPQPSLMPNVDSTLRSIARWKYIIKTDLTSAYFQIPLQKESMKYCGIASPFKGIRCYTRCAMGMPGSETALEELMCHVLGDIVEKGWATKIADDLYCGARVRSICWKTGGRS